MFVFSNLATSLDGKIATRSRAHFPLGTAADRRHMLVLRKRADAVLIGASTLRAFRGPLLSGASGKQPLNVIVSSRLEGLSPRWKFFTDPRTRKILFVSHSASEARVKLFSRYAQIVRLKPATARNPIASQIVRYLEELGTRRLLVEGGGGVMWDFVQARLLDEVHLTLTPRILGGTEAPTLVDGQGFAPKQVANFKLQSCSRLNDELYLVYKRAKKAGP